MTEFMKVRAGSTPDTLVATFRNRSYTIMRAGNKSRLLNGEAFVMGESGNRRKPIKMTTMPINTVWHAVIDGTLPQTDYVIVLLPDDFDTFQNIRRFRVVEGGKP